MKLSLIVIASVLALAFVVLSAVGFFTPIVWRTADAPSPSGNYVNTHGIPRYHEVRFQDGAISASRVYLGCDRPRGRTWSLLGIDLLHEVSVENRNLIEKTTMKTRAWIPIAILSAAPFCAMIRGPLRRRSRHRRGLCISCGYDLTGNISGTCPECGADLPENGAVTSRQ